MISTPSNSHRQEHRFQGALLVAMRSLGWLLPETEAEVKAAGQEDAGEGLELLDEPIHRLIALDKNCEADHSRVA